VIQRLIDCVDEADRNNRQEQRGQQPAGATTVEAM
jgi:hypothetical protein